MASRQTSVRARSEHGAEVALQTTTTEAPLIPISQIQQLKEVAPHQVDWVFQETSKEAEFRRSEMRRVNTMHFLGHLGTLLAAVTVVGLAIGACVYCAHIHESATATTIAASTVVALAYAFLSANRRSGKEDDKDRRK